MDKYEYKVRSEEILKLIDKEKYTEAAKIADTIDWRRVKSATMLLKIAILYRINRRGDDCREILLLAYDRYPGNRSVVYSLCELSIELDDVVSAVEYYKQFVKLAPKDNGVYTLRYRILEAQEASIEERIEILEELKKRDYQEEWAYELAYLYHRAGFETKCVEECDDIILWFGDGPYVMKAMELKAMHTPLTDIQQKNYEIMLGNIDNNYSAAEQDAEDFADQNYSAEDYDGQNYDTEYYDPENYDEQNYDTGNYEESNYGSVDNSNEFYEDDNYEQENYVDSNYEQEAYTEETYADGSYGQENYTEETYIDGSYEQENYTEEAYTDGGYGQENYTEETYTNGGYEQENYTEETYTNGGYEQENYAEETYANDGYEQEAYTEGTYTNEGYVQENYAGDTYSDDGEEQENYTEETYTQNDYGQNNFVDDGYGNLSYPDSSYPEGSYSDNSYTGEFYVEQVYDENGNIMNPETYDEQDYSQEEDTSKKYRNGLHLVEKPNTPVQAAGNAGDMSQYNTINLQKVVAESMKELFPDDDDVFAEDREKYNSSEPVVGNTKSDTRVFAVNDNLENSSLESLDSYAQTGRVAQMVTGVVEKPPEPNTGAIKKVFVPGDNARLIKSDSDIEQLRDITEKSVDDEHNRMENNDENVYHERSITDINEASEALKSQITNSMKLDNVLVEWERMKQDNAKKRQEEFKKQVLTQTGKIFENFDNSIKSGILGELDREEKRSRMRTVAPSTRDRFLDADVTDDIPQPLVSEDDFETAYIAEGDSGNRENKVVEAEKTQKLQEAEYLDEGGEDAGDAYLAMLERVTSKINLKEMNTAVGAADDRDNAHIQEKYTQDDGRNEIGKTDKYEPEIEAREYEQEMYAEDKPENGINEAREYEQEVYAEDKQERENDDYTQEVYAEDSAEYMVSDYTQEIPAESAVDYTSDEYKQEMYTEEETAEEYTQDYTQEIPVEGIENYDEYTQEFAEETYVEEDVYSPKDSSVYRNGYHAEDVRYTQKALNEVKGNLDTPRRKKGHDEQNVLRRHQQYQFNERELDPEDAQSIAEMAQEDALKTQEIKMNTADLSSLSEKIVATTNKEARGAAREELREFTPEEQELFENFAVTKKIKKQIIHALDNMTLAAYTGNVIITGDAGLDTVRMAKNLVKEYQLLDEGFSGRLAKITGEKINQRNIKEIFEKLNNGGIIIEKANAMSEEKLYEMAHNLNQDNLGIVVIMEDTKKEITKLLEKQAMIADYFNIRIDLMEMDNNALVAYAKNYALALEYSIDELGTLALYTRIANMQSGNHVVTKDEVRDIIDEAIWKSKKSKIKNFVDVLFARRYDNEDMIVLKERDFM